LKILVIGKPRSGKTTLARNLSKTLNLVHINVENWINDLLARIKAYEPPEDLEEG
jgi:adenylate kinase family enzyme